MLLQSPIFPLPPFVPPPPRRRKYVSEEGKMGGGGNIVSFPQPEDLRDMLRFWSKHYDFIYEYNKNGNINTVSYRKAFFGTYLQTELKTATS